jgi:hypothetical protein
VVKRRGSSTFIGLDAAINLNYSTKNDESTVCHFCPNNCSRTFIDTETPTADQPLHLGLLVRERHRREQGGPQGAETRAQAASASSSRTSSKRRRAWPSGTSSTPRRCRSPGSARTTSRSVGCSFLRVARKGDEAGLQALERRSLAGEGRHPPGAQPVQHRAVLAHLPGDARACRRRTSCSQRDQRGDVAGGRPLRLDRPLLPEQGRPGARPRADLQGPRRPAEAPRAAELHLQPVHHPRAEFGSNTMDTASCPIVAGSPTSRRPRSPRRSTSSPEGGINTSMTAVTFTEPNLLKRSAVRGLGPAPGHHRRRERLGRRPGSRRARRVRSPHGEARGREILEQVEREHKVAILMIGRPYHSDPGLNHGIPEEFQAGVTRSSPCAVDPRDPRT